jgi:hypothetical protein
MAVARSRRRTSDIDERLGLLEIARAHAILEEEGTSLPPGQRDGSGFWFPAGYRDPLALFTPHQRSLQAKQRLLKNRRSRPAQPPMRPSVEVAARPPLAADAPAATAAPAPAPSPRAAEPRVHRSTEFPRVDSSGRSV